MIKYVPFRSVALILGLHAVSALAQPAAIPKDKTLRPTVKAVTQSVACNHCDGVVEKIDADGMTVVEKRDRNVTVTHQFVPIDVLRKGEVIANATFGCAYRWADVKKGDTVHLEVLKDDADGRTYCLQVSIRRRPGGKLPESQNPENDRWYDAHRVLNEIENGNDVSDEELLRTWPPEPDDRTGGYYPGGLPKKFVKHHELLTANRKRIAEEKAKKEKEAGLKAKPAADKVDPKKADKK